ncbi:MFS transporter [Frankia gtarii]|uniref:MFS transporter n=1 Tax=Frankia gtarii TaxID=2950102 RepID=UPI0021C02401|nr:MFS transporter [Frankia gtarii]
MSGGVTEQAVAATPLAGRLMASRGARTSLLIAGVAMAAGSVVLTGLGVSTSLLWFLLAYVLVGLGFGMVNALITNTAVTCWPPRRGAAPRPAAHRHW